MTIEPPHFSSKNFEIYKLELLAWSEVTEISKSKQAIVITLSITDNDIRENIFTQLSLDDLKQENGPYCLIQFLDSFLGKDEITDTVEKYEDFENLQRADNQSITEFITCFELKYMKLEKRKIKLTPEILAFQLIRKANISKEMRMLVLTGINFAEREKMYEQSKESLRKFLGDFNRESALDVTGEPRYLAERRNGLLKVEFVKQPDGCNKQRESNRDGNGVKGLRKRINPVGADGNTLLCRSCGSYRHLLKDCPDSWENIKKRSASVGSKQMRKVHQKCKEGIKCCEESGGGQEPEKEGASSGIISGLMAQIETCRKKWQV